jgi:putative ABC transport system ATP-binding protein
MGIVAENITKNYRLGNTTVAALRGVDFTAASGEFVAIAGPSGSGKSTLLNILGAIELPTAGRVLIDQADLTQLSSNDLADLRARKMGYIFQTFNLLSVLTALENVEYPLLLNKISSNEREPRAMETLRHVGLENFAHHKPAQLSGGQRQRVAIARALVGKPSLILADEPTANLDGPTALEVIQLMKDLNHRTGVTFVLATHDPKILERVDRVVHLENGRLATESLPHVP